jgi:hypothetical protein
MLDSRRLRFGLLAVSINAVLYTLVYVFLTIGGGAPSSFTPWLAIPAEIYYRYNRFFLAPSMFAGWSWRLGSLNFSAVPLLEKAALKIT